MTRDTRQQQTAGGSPCGTDDHTKFCGWAASTGDDKKQLFHKVTFSPRVLGPKDVEIEIAFCGVCVSDIHITGEDWCKLHGGDAAVVPGHEIVGKVTKTGPKAHFKVGDCVGATAVADACLECELCTSGHEQLCPKVTYIFKDTFQDGCSAPSFGGFADRIRVNSEFVYAIPDTIPLKQAAPLFCAGLSAYTALRKNGAGPKKTVGVVGIGSLGHLELQFAKAMGCKKIVALLDSAVHAEDVTKLGATKMIDLKDHEQCMSEAHMLDLVLVNSFDKSTPWDNILTMVKTKGTVVILAISKEPLQIPTMNLVYRQISIQGSFQGGRSDVKEMLDFAAKHQIQPWIEIAPMDRINETLEARKNLKSRFCTVLEGFSSMSRFHHERHAVVDR
ncbi:hypothetical protein BGZ83_007608 [Gryganskiella cystojenkinii]|nr:hypothetical protein BGZ83_007608 [Gryganskiella cystojenkinii]